MNYDKIFEGDIERKFFYTDYRGPKLVVGYISLEKAIQRLSKEEYYVLVHYREGEELPIEYRPLPEYRDEDGTLFATVDPDFRPHFFFHYICQNGGIQMISRLMDLEPGNPNYLLGPGPGEISLGNLINEQMVKYNVQKGEKERGR